MRRSMAVCALLLGLVAGLMGSSAPALAARATEQGVGPIKKMVADNGQDTVVVKVYGTGGKGKIRWVNTTLRGRDGTRYLAQGAHYPGGVWAVHLETGEELVECDGLRLTWNGPKKFWRFVVPRTCLADLTDRIRVRADLVSVNSARPGEAGPTRWLARG